jgi:hypothetical protein
MRREWQPLDEEHVEPVGGHMGVYELSGPKGTVVCIGFAGGRSTFGLRGELREKLLQTNGDDRWFRYEITSSYLSRFRELIMIHIHDFGSLPVENAPDGYTFGRLSPG